ncbi:DUF3857 and transglutaminase domain-containing protein [bacterium]|nr:DUF3857 and transglutaminase domain-containing protein [bacterium]
MKKYSILLLTLIFLSCILNADMVILKNASEHIGQVNQISDSKVFLKDESGKSHEFLRNAVLKVIFHHKKGDTSQKTIDSIKDEFIKKLYKDSDDFIKKYPNSGYITLLSDTKYVVNPDLTWSAEYHSIIKILKERGKSVSNRSIYYNPDRETAEIVTARSIAVDGKVYYLDDSSVKKGSVYSSIPQYDKYMKIKFAMKKAEIGSILEIKTRMKSYMPQDILNPFEFEALFRFREPVLEKRVSVKVPKGMRLSIFKRNFEDKVKCIKTETDEDVIYSFSRKNLPETESESYMPLRNKMFPYLMVSISEKWDTIHNEFARLLGRKNTKRTELQKKMKEVLKNCKTIKEKIYKAYEFVVKEIRYVGVSPLMYKFEPKFPDEILKNGLANSIDKTFLFYSILKDLGVNVRFCLMKSKFKGDLVKEVPNINQIGRPVLLIRLNGQKLFVDCLYDTVALGEIIPSLQWTEGIALDQSLKDKFVKIPLNSVNRDSWKTKLKINVLPDGALHIIESNMTTGMYADYIRGWKDYNEEELKKKFEKIVSGIHQKSELIKYKLINYDKLDRLNTGYDIEYKLNDYCIKGGKKILVFRIPSFSGYSASSVGKSVKERHFDIRLNNVSLEHNDIEINIDKAFKVNYLPKSSEFSKSGLKYSVKFVQKGQKIMVTDNYEQNKLNYPKQFYGYLKKCLEQKAEVGKMWVVIERR